MTVEDPLPGFPPLPDAAATAPEGGSVLRLVRSLDSAALEARHGGLHALVVLEGRDVLDGYLEEAGSVETGAGVLDRLDGVPLAAVRVLRLPAALVRALPWYWRAPARVVIAPERWMDGELLLRSFARAGQHGVVCVRAGGDALGAVFLEDEAVLGAYRAGGDRVGGVEEVLPLLEERTAVVVARLEAHGAGTVERLRDRERLLDDIEAAIRAELHDHAEPAVAVFRAAPDTPEGLLEAAARLEGMRIRMISPGRMRAVAGRARQVIAAASPAR